MKANLCSSVSFGAMAQRRMDGSFALPLMDFTNSDETWQEAGVRAFDEEAARLITENVEKRKSRRRG